MACSALGWLQHTQLYCFLQWCQGMKAMQMMMRDSVDLEDQCETESCQFCDGDCDLCCFVVGFVIWSTSYHK